MLSLSGAQTVLAGEGQCASASPHSCCWHVFCRERFTCQYMWMMTLQICITFTSFSIASQLPVPLWREVHKLMGISVD